MKPTEAFLSHSDKDRAFVTKLAGVLLRRGVRFFYSRKHLKGAQQWHDEIGEALARCDWFLLVLSPAAVRSEWVKRELLYALQSDRYRDRIAPLLHRDCDSERLSWTLSGFQLIDFTAGFDEGCGQLFRCWGMRHGRAQTRRVR